VTDHDAEAEPAVHASGRRARDGASTRDGDGAGTSDGAGASTRDGAGDGAGDDAGPDARSGDPHWFCPLARFVGTAYLRNAFTKGTEREVAFLVEHLGLAAGAAVLDVGCGPGRHARALAERGLRVTGVDISPEFVALARAGAPPGATFEVADARHLTYEGEFDLVLSACQGAFGLLGAGDVEVLAGMARAARAGGHVVVDTFSAAFALRHLEPGETFDLVEGVLHERAVVRGPAGDEQPFDLWTTCYTPRELRLLAERCGLLVESISASTPGGWGTGPPDLEHPGLLLVARRRGVV
jgi:SAM-dependent methyltransferase